MIAFTEEQVRRMVAKRVEQAGSLRALAAEWGVSFTHLCDVRKGRRGPGPAVLAHLGLIRVVAYRKAPVEVRP